MNDAISRQEALRRIENFMYVAGGNAAVQMCCEIIQNMPAIDTVPVVRCKDCIHRYSSEFCECRPEDAFCSDGER